MPRKKIVIDKGRRKRRAKRGLAVALIAQIALINLPMLLALAALSTAQAAEPETLTLACKGTEEILGAAVRTDTTSIRVIVDFQNRTVTLGDDLLNIYSLNEATISFRAIITSGAGTFVRSMDSTIDRMSGELVASSITTDQKTRETILSVSLDLKCRPTMF